MYSVLVKPNNRWSMVTAAGRYFNKTEPVEIQDDEITDEIINHPMLDVSHNEDDEQPKAPKKRGRPKTEKSESEGE